MRTDRSYLHSSFTSTSGQIVLEYVLLLVIGVSVAMLITTTMVSRNTENPGFLVRKWYEIIQLIGSDNADDLNPEESK